MHSKLIRVFIALLVILLAGSVILPQAFAQEETPTPSGDSEPTAQPDPQATPDSEATPAVSIDIGENLSAAAASVDLSSLEPVDLIRLILAIVVIVVFTLFGRRLVTNLLNRFANRHRNKHHFLRQRCYSGCFRQCVVLVLLRISIIGYLYEHQVLF
jgi:hypothetical protein